eukprot:TRINITY_DN3160_c0_g2_i1.p1 TRINITY_DN3160_c0_g2~~TRINITY_DN3160_c0_g2_i1.p1  ORF type:complete len:241 (+),score=24.12 TRINITY_DN3160_c0_g2_i1:186-908(+)
MAEEHQTRCNNDQEERPGLPDFPAEVLLMMVGWLGVKSVLCLELTCRTLRRVCRDPATWRSLGSRRFVDFESALLGPGGTQEDSDVSPRAVVLRMFRAEMVETVLDLTIMIKQQPTTLRRLIETSSSESGKPFVVGKVAPGVLSAKTIRRVIYVAYSTTEPHTESFKVFVTVVGRWFDGGWFRYTCKFGWYINFIAETPLLSSSRSVVMKASRTIADDRFAPWTLVYLTKIQKYRQHVLF